MKTKSFLVFSTSVIATSLFLIIFHSQQQQSLQSIVTRTHQHIKDFQENLRDVEENQMVKEEKYSHLLGLDGSLELWHNTTVPVVVTYAFGDAHAMAVNFIRAASRLPYTILLYNLGLNSNSLAVVTNYCNSSKCVVIDFDLNVFPSHVSDTSNHAFRPLIIQHALTHIGGVIFSDLSYRWSGTLEELNTLWSSASSQNGILAWTSRPAVTSLTHPRMFNYFHADKEDFLFLKMVDLSKLMVSNKSAVGEVMRTWIQCALTIDCIMPIGAQSVGCRFDKKPQYRYSGCHGQDASALTIILGQRYNLEESQYAYSGFQQHWAHVTRDQANEQYLLLSKNSTEYDSSEPLTLKATT